jgi:2,4-dienoyl-CoA reductase-like NADH-dependent reductase (Old Yellow Enzyme family)
VRSFHIRDALLTALAEVTRDEGGCIGIQLGLFGKDVSSAKIAEHVFIFWADEWNLDSLSFVATKGHCVLRKENIRRMSSQSIATQKDTDCLAIHRLRGLLSNSRNFKEHGN